MKWSANISRILTALVFIFSGFVKGVDPLGTAYRLEDYFIAFHWDALMPFALPLSILLCAGEFTVGVMLLLNIRMRITAWLLLIMMLYFTGLTLNDAINNPVPDCGCFGDAIKLTNWQTFYKNLILMPFTLLIFIWRRNFKGFAKPVFQTLMGFGIFFIATGFSYRCYTHLPAIDFTEWKVGHKLYPDNPKPVKYYLTYKSKTSGESKEYLSPNYPYNDSLWMLEWEFVSQRVEDPNQYYGKSLVISDTTGTNVTESMVRNPGYQLIINAWNLEQADAAAFKQVNELAAQAYRDDVPTAVIVSADNEQIKTFAIKNQLKLDFYTADDIVLKTIVRSNPGMLLMKDGVILQKWHYNDFPAYGELQKWFQK
jgi:uncharacterized membrane protein YphA (DoxX/SURF4 family)